VSTLIGQQAALEGVSSVSHAFHATLHDYSLRADVHLKECATYGSKLFSFQQTIHVIVWTELYTVMSEIADIAFIAISETFPIKL
jgi:hypothetical protein